MTKTEWARHVPALRKAVDKGQKVGLANLWHDNEKFLQIPEDYKARRLRSMRFPPNSGDLNPIETVWARLWQDLSLREMQDLQAGKVLYVAQFRQRAAQILTSYGEVRRQENHSYLQKLVRGMPKRLAACKANAYGPCGK